MREDILGSLLC